MFDIHIESFFKKVQGSLSANDVLDTLSVTVTKARADGTGEDFVWRVASRSPQCYTAAQNMFLGVDDGDKTIKQSLLYDTYTPGTFWYGEWGGKKKNRESTTEVLSFEPSLNAKPFTVPRTNQENETINSKNHTKLKSWISCLSANFLQSGSTLWFPLSFEDNGIFYSSSVFCVFNGPIKPITQNKISKILQEQLIGLIVSIQSKYVLERYSFALRKLINHHSPSIVRNENVENQIFGLQNVIRSRVPLLIEGEPGTGKMTVAKTIIKNDCEINGAPNLQTITIDMGTFNSSFDEYLKDFELGRCAIVLDDVHLASASEQRKILQLIKQEASLDERPMIFLTVSPSAAEALEFGTLIYDLYTKVAPFAVKLPSLATQINDILIENHNTDIESTAVQKEFLAKIVHSFLVQFDELEIQYEGSSEPGLVNDIVAQLITERKWDGNYSELKHRVLRYVLLNENK